MTFELLVQDFAVFVGDPRVTQFEIAVLRLCQFLWAWNKYVFYAQVDKETAMVAVEN
jgi:hypothetical protein